jgi:hypothetical protein
MRYPADPEDRFWSRTYRRNGHVIFRGKQFRIGGGGSRRLQPVQFAWMLRGGELIEGSVVVRTCRRVGCVEHIEQVDECEWRASSIKAAQLANRKLSPSQVRALRSLPVQSTGIRGVIRRLAESWGVHPHYLYTIRYRRSAWRAAS